MEGREPLALEEEGERIGQETKRNKGKRLIWLELVSNHKRW